MKLLEQGYAHKACESAWGAVDRITRALALKYLGREEPEVVGGEFQGKTWMRREPGWMEFLRQALARAGFDERESESLIKDFTIFREGLHGNCFYGGRFDPECHFPMIERDVPEYIRKLKTKLTD